MKAVNDENILERLVKLVNLDKYGICRFLLSTPYTDHDYHSFNGIIDDNVFFDILYYESKSSAKIKSEILNKLSLSSGKNTFFILGYQGCGKSTFIYSLLNDFVLQTNMSIGTKDDYLIDCDIYGIESESDPLKIIFQKKLLYFFLNNESAMKDFVDFYNKNFAVISVSVVSNVLLKARNYFTKYIGETKNIKNEEDLSDLQSYLSNLSVRDCMFLLVTLLIAKSYNLPKNEKHIILLLFDNIDYIDDYKQLQYFVNAIHDLTIEMDRIFTKLILHNSLSTSSSKHFTELVKIIVAMRETTRANLPDSHHRDFFHIVHDYIDMTELYEKTNIIDKRMNFLLKSKTLDRNRKKEIDIIKEIYDKDKNYTDSIFVPLYNNNYRRVSEIITKVIIEHPNEINEYCSLIQSNPQYLRNGARGILFKYILDTFNSEIDGEENCLKKIGVINLLNKQHKGVSIARMLLAHLSEFTETRCDNARKCISIEKVIKDFEGIYAKDEIITSLLNMYSLKDSAWSHLITFSRLESKDTIKKMFDTKDYSGLNTSETMIHYTCAGRIYLEVVTMHFEFFSTRVHGSKYPSLFCKSNYKNDNKKYVKIIQGVIGAVAHCCSELNLIADLIRSNKGVNGSMMSEEEYVDSCFILTNKKYNKKDGVFSREKQLHADRVINAHIGYLDRFRLYVLSGKEIKNKKEFNEQLCGFIELYINLLTNTLIMPYTRTKLLPFYESQLKEIKKTSYTDFTTIIKKNI